MKTILLLLCSVGISSSTYSQKTIEVSFDKSVIIVYGVGGADNEIKNINVGLKESVSFKKTENKVLLQALEENFRETNLFVELISGNIFVYKLVYNNNPSLLLHIEETNTKIPVAKVGEGPLANTMVNKGEKPVARYVETDITAEKPDRKIATVDETAPSHHKIISDNITRDMDDYIMDIAEIKYRMQVSLGGIFVTPTNEYLFKINIVNNSNTVYDVGVIDILIKDKNKKLKGKVNNDNRLELLNDCSALSVPARSNLSFLVKTKMIAISDSKKCVMTIWENHPGERAFTLDIPYDELLRIKRLGF